MRILILVAMALGTLSCQQNESEMEVALSPNTAYLIDAPAYTCMDISSGAQAGTLAAFSFRFRSLQINWKGQKPLTVSYIRLTAKGANLQNGSFECTLAGEEAEILLGLSAGDVIDPKTIVNTPGGATKCSVACGGVNLVDKTRNTAVPLQIKVVGSTLNDEGTDIPAVGYANAILRN